MLPERLEDLAEMIRDQRKQLEAAATELRHREDALTACEGQLLIDAAILRLTLVEEWLVPSRLPTRRLPRLRYEASRVRALTTPRLGRLRHYPPRPLLLPRSYWREPPPDPAPSISIVTPTFQHGRFIERTILSILAQRYPRLEYVVQDGKSTDGTVTILERYGDQIAGWFSEADEGQADAINRGFLHTSGEIMAWLNSDDLLLPGSLAYVGRFFATHPEVDVVYGNRLLIDDNDRQIGAWILPRHDDFALTLADFVPQESLFWRRSLWDAVGGRIDEAFAYAMDWDLLLRFREIGATMVRVPRFLGAFRIHAEQKTTVAHPLGQLEMARLRKRLHGREVPVAEVVQLLRPYLRRHVRQHLRQRVLDHLPAARDRYELPHPHPIPGGVAPTPAPQIPAPSRPSAGGRGRADAPRTSGAPPPPRARGVQLATSPEPSVGTTAPGARVPRPDLASAAFHHTATPPRSPHADSGVAA